jgi:serine protease Do
MKGMRLKYFLLFGLVWCWCLLPGSLAADAALFGLGSATPPSLAPLVDKVKPSVVNISTTRVLRGGPLPELLGPDSPLRKFFGEELFNRFFGDLQEDEFRTHSLGSGFIISTDGFILTNNHVVEKATDIRIKLQNGKEYTARVVGRDPPTDLALIKVEPGPGFAKPAQLGDSAAVAVGDWVMALGNPFGLGHSVTVGIISAKGRVIGAGPFDDFLQTDAAINPGNSGGPLFNMKGEVVGISTAMVARGQNIGFATPINTAKDLLPQLQAGKIIRGWLGVRIQDLTPELAESFGVKEARGVLVADVEAGSPAARAGLRRGDILQGLDGRQIANAQELVRRISATQPGSRVSIELIRNGRKQSLQVTVGTLPVEGETWEAADLPEETTWGFSVRILTPVLAERLGMEPDTAGVLVAKVEAGSSADRAGLQRGDVIREVNRKSVADLAAFQKLMADVEQNRELLLLILRDGQPIFLAMAAPGRS